MQGTHGQATSETSDRPLTYRAATTMAEREAAFHLIYKAYLESSLVMPNQIEMRILPHHLLSTTEVFVALRDDRVVSTVSLVRDGELGLPMEEVYSEQIDAQRLMNRQLGEVSCLASEANLNLKVCMELFRVMVQAARRRGVDAMLVAIHPKHERFYRRYLAFESLGGRTGYPAVCNNPAVALMLDFDRIDIERPTNWDRFFGQPLPDESIRANSMTVAEKRHIARLLVKTNPLNPGMAEGCVTESDPLCVSPEGNLGHLPTKPEAVSQLLNFEPVCIG